MRDNNYRKWDGLNERVPKNRGKATVKRVFPVYPSYGYGCNSFNTLEELIKFRIGLEKERYDEDMRPENMFGFDEETGEIIEYDTPDTIRERLSWPDSMFNRNERAQRIRVPSMKRNNHEWEGFYRLFPSIAVEVALGERRFIDGAKLKYIPLFEKLLNEVWKEEEK